MRAFSMPRPLTDRGRNLRLTEERAARATRCAPMPRCEAVPHGDSSHESLPKFDRTSLSVFPREPCRRYLSTKRTDNGQIWKVNLKIQVAFGHIGEIEFAQCVGGSGFGVFSLSPQKKTGPRSKFLPPRKYFSPKFSVFSFSTEF